MSEGRNIGDVILVLDDISLSFGGVKALQEVSFDVREHEIRAIIGPNGAGKSSMLNVINGVYHPQKGRIRFHGEERKNIHPHEAAREGRMIASTGKILAAIAIANTGRDGPGTPYLDRSAPARGSLESCEKGPVGSNAESASGVTTERRRADSPWAETRTTQRLHRRVSRL